MASRFAVETDVEVPMSDGTVLRADLYLPERLPAPTLVSRTPYLKGLVPGLMAALNPMRAVQQGFAVLVQDVRGRGASAGEFDPFVNEAADGADTLRWVARQPWCDGKLGMFGSSYMGATQLQAAAERPSGLGAICPIQAVSDYYEGRSFRGGAFELGGMASIALWNLAAGTLLRSGLGGKTLRQRFAEARAALSDLSGFLKATPSDSLRQTVLGELAPFLFTWWENDQADALYWEPLRIEDRYEAIDTPALHITSWFDQFHVGTLRNYEGLRARAATEAARAAQTLVVGPWGHYPPKSTLLGSVRVGELDLGLGAFLDMEALQLAWFKRWLQPDAATAPGKRVRLYVMGRNEWRDEDDWPLARAKEVPLYLASPDGSHGELTWQRAGAQIDARFTFDPQRPVPTRGGAHMVLEAAYPHGPVEQREVENRPDVLVFRTQPLVEEVEVTGWVRAELWVQSSAPATDFTVKLVDVWPDGSAYNVCDGIRRLRVGELNSGDWLHLAVEMGATSQVFLSGHCIGVQVSSSNFPRFDLASNTAAPPRLATTRDVAHQRVGIGGVRASRVMLPLVPVSKEFT